MTLLVCPLEAVADHCRTRGPSHLLTLLSPGHPGPEIEPAHGPRHRLRLDMHDIAEPTEGLVAPHPPAIVELLAFARTWSGERPFLIHCWAGVSRSTAAALAVACLRRPDLDELRVAHALRAAAPWATPNPLILALADDLLGRDGRLVGAGPAIGRGAEFVRPQSFELDPHAL